MWWYICGYQTIMVTIWLIYGSYMVNIWLINGISTNVISNIYMNISLVEYVYPLLWLSINGIYGDITVFYMELIWN